MWMTVYCKLLAIVVVDITTTEQNNKDNQGLFAATSSFMLSQSSGHIGGGGGGGGGGVAVLYLNRGSELMATGKLFFVLVAYFMLQESTAHRRCPLQRKQCF